MSTLSTTSSHGYREMIGAARGTMTLADATQHTMWAIHSYVRRQDLWLNKQPDYR